MSELPSKERLLALKQQFVDDGYNDIRDDEVMAVIDALLAAQEREPVGNAGECDTEVYEKGKSACMVAIPKEDAEIICRGISAATGCKVDWHYVGGRVHIKALNPAPSIPAAVPAEVVKGILEIVRVRKDLHAFDGDKRGIAECLCEKEEALICLINEHHDDFRGVDGGAL